jgi:predicted  nucleic acid-binding Zn-ribbon protein
MIGIALLACAVPANGQTIPQAQSELSSVLTEMENNLVVKEAIEMNFKDWQSHYDSWKVRLDDYNQRMGQLNAYCQGTFEHDEYVRRVAQCDSTASQLADLLTQLNPEDDDLKAQLSKLKQRDTDRQADMDKLQQGLSEGLKHLTFACAMLSTSEFAADCHLPPAPGPRTADLVASLNKTIAGAK